MISVLVLTKNEEADLPACLASVSWSDDIHVFDSHSTDGTVAVAEAAGARVTCRIFDGYASQRNAALHSLPFKYPWVLILDADERIPPETAAALRKFCESAPPEIVAARLRRRDFLMNVWLKHAQASPFYIRLVRPHKVRYEREINEVLLTDGPVHDLPLSFDHYPFSKGIAHWVAKHNSYSTAEAAQVLASRRGEVQFSLRRAMFARDFNERRFHQKELFYRMPFRPLIKWFYMMIWRRAFMDGRAGITVANLQTLYEYLIVVKTRELIAQSKGPAVHP